MVCRFPHLKRRLILIALGLLWVSLAMGAERLLHPLNSTTDADCVVTFNEVLYHPAGNGSDLEWIELHNQLAVDQDLSGWSIEGAIDYRFPKGTTLAAGGYLVVAADPASLQAIGGVIGAFGPWTGRLDNTGDRLVLRNLNGRLMDELRYDDDAPWPVAADGSGASLAKHQPSSPSSPPQNWRASLEVGGTPGALNFPEPGEAPPPVVDTLLAKNSSGRWQIPTAATAELRWQAAELDDRSWNHGTNGFGFASSAGPGVPPAQRYYRFEGTGADASGNRVHGLIQNGARYVTEPAPAEGSHSSVRFDGTDEFFKVDDSTAPTAYTISAWVKFETIRACSLVVLTDASGPQSSWSHQLRLNEAGNFEHYTFDGGLKVVTGTTVTEVGRWYHVAATAENNGVARLFVNGVEEGTAAPIGELWRDGTRWVFGSNSGATPEFLRGWIDEVAIWHQVLDVSSIVALAAGSPPATGGGLTSVFVTDLGPAMAGINPSAWFRLPFVLPARTSYDQLTLSVRYADGFVAFLNGVEVARRNAPGELPWNSQATVARTAAEAAQPEIISLNAYLGQLRAGGNILAIQGLNLSAADPDFLVETTLTARRANRPTTASSMAFSEVPGAGARPFWFEVMNHGSLTLDLSRYVVRTVGGDVIPLGNGSLAPNSFHWVQVPRSGPAVTAGELLVLASADGAQVFDAVRLDEAAQARQIGAAGGEFLRPSASTPGTENTFALAEGIVINEILYHAPPTFPRPGTPPEVETRPVIAWDSSWKYDASGNEPGVNWFDPMFDDSSWASGPGVLGFRTGVLAEPIRTTLPSGQWTYYFRVPFVLPALPASDCPLQLRFLVDDGAVLYLNGQEFHRHRMPEGEITSTTPAINVGDPPVIGPLALESSGLVVGTNWLAIEVHQWNRDSSDLVCGAELLSCEVTKPGLPATPFAESEEQWIELFNRSAKPMSLAGWQLAGAVSFLFPPDTILGAGEYLVVARDAAALRARYPNIRVLGDFSGRLSRRSDHLRLLDSNGNPADEVRYADDRPWPHAADGGGSSLELRDPRSDNSVPEAWSASDESRRSLWHSYRFRATARDPVFGPPLYGFHELRLGLLDDGELLLDNVSVIEDPDGAHTELIQNGSFTSGATYWRLLGNHSHSGVQDDPDRPGNAVLRVVATDARGYLH
ncbi:MAG TPA: hypothetical protein DCE44_12850, partial [Verrucomicrobiales bacterium]|nr:hypothetical protein [Verrucomicrobiales bacterium]